MHVGDDWINAHLVELGAAWHYKEYSQLTYLDDAKKFAKQHSRGLWADEHAEPPWDFRASPAVKARRLASSSAAE